MRIKMMNEYGDERIIKFTLQSQKNVLCRIKGMTQHQGIPFARGMGCFKDRAQV